MAGVAAGRANLYHNRLTVPAFIYCLLIAWAGCLFGLDLDESSAYLHCLPKL